MDYKPSLNKRLLAWLAGLTLLLVSLCPFQRSEAGEAQVSRIEALKAHAPTLVAARGPVTCLAQAPVLQRAWAFVVSAPLPALPALLFRHTAESPVVFRSSALERSPLLVGVIELRI